MASSGLSVSKGLGHHGHWGFSASFDMLEALEKNAGTPNADELHSISMRDEPINILLIQPGDIRHILSTISRQNRHDMSRPLHFYLLENPVEILARDLALLQLLSDYSIPIRQRATVFLEVYGNCKVQRRTSELIEKLGAQMKHLLATGTGILSNVLDFGLLKHRERDDLELAFKYYARTVAFDMGPLLDARYRAIYEERFDARKSLFDWDYHSVLRNRASIIHIKQFKEWRSSGIAFEFGDQQYTESNRTLLSYTEGTMKGGKEKGIKKEIKGFWGDVTSSPFATYGTDCEIPNKLAEGLFEILNKGTGTEQHRHHSVEVALYNMFSELWELETSSIYTLTKANDVYSGLGEEARWVEPSVHDSSVDGGLADLTEEDTKDSTVDKEGPSKDKALQSIREEEEEEEEEDRKQEKGEGAEREQHEEVMMKKKDLAEEIVDTPAIERGQQQEKQESVATTAGPEPIKEAAGANPKEQRIKAIYRAIQRSQSVVDHFSNVKIFTMVGSPASALAKPKFAGFFHSVFISARAAAALGEAPVAAALSPRCMVAVETGKFLVPLGKEAKKEFVEKEKELATAAGLQSVPPPVPRRRRDEEDTEDDVIFFIPAAHSGVRCESNQGSG